MNRLESARTRSPVFIRVFGQLTVETRDGVVAVPRGQVDALLRILLVHPNETVGADELIDGLWPGTRSDDEGAARDRLYVLVNRVRQFLLGVRPAASLRIDTIDGGYRLAAGPADIDRLAFEAAVGAARDGHDGAVRAALELWRGEPYADFPDTDDVDEVRRFLFDLRRALPDGEPAEAAPVDLAQTRLVRPSIESELLVPRQHLVDRIGRVGERSVVLVTAPAGYGKTVLLAQWAAAREALVGWVSLEPEDTDLARAWSSVTRALALVGAVAELTVPDGVAPGSPRYVDAVADAINADRDRGPVALVLDDADHLAGSTALVSLSELSSRTHGRLTIVLGARSGIRLLAQLDDGIDVLDADDLRLTADEIAEIAGRAGIDHHDDLEELTDGWAIAVSHLSRSERRRAGYDAAAGALETYIVTEVLAGMPDEVRRFLIETAPLDWLSADLCESVTGDLETASHLRWLHGHGLVLLGRSADTGWYRCHALVNAALRELADRDPSIDVAAIRRRAGHWFAANGMPDRALSYAIAADDGQLVAELAADVVERATDASEMHSCVRWLQTIDPDDVAANRAAHDFLTLAASYWLGHDDLARWDGSRRRYFGDDDPIVTANAGRDAYLNGRAHESVVLAERAIAAADGYFSGHRSHPRLHERFLRLLRMRATTGRILARSIGPDAPELEVLESESRRAWSVMSMWLYGEWAFLALVEGRADLAADLVARSTGRLASFEPLSARLGAGRLITSQVLVESAATDASRQAQLIDRLRPIANLYRDLGRTSDLVPVLLAIHAVASRAGDWVAADAARGEADLLMLMFDDAPLFVRARAVLDPFGGGFDSAPDAVDSLAELAVSALTARERSVLELLVDGLTYDQIADRLDVSRNTVSSHVSAAYRKLGVGSRAELLARLGTRSDGSGDLRD